MFFVGALTPASVEYKNLSFANVGGIILNVDADKNQVTLCEEEFKKVCVFDE